MTIKNTIPTFRQLKDTSPSNDFVVRVKVSWPSQNSKQINVRTCTNYPHSCFVSTTQVTLTDMINPPHGHHALRVERTLRDMLKDLAYITSQQIITNFKDITDFARYAHKPPSSPRSQTSSTLSDITSRDYSPTHLRFESLLGPNFTDTLFDAVGFCDPVLKMLEFTSITSDPTAPNSGIVCIHVPRREQLLH